MLTPEESQFEAKFEATCKSMAFTILDKIQRDFPSADRSRCRKLVMDYLRSRFPRLSTFISAEMIWGEEIPPTIAAESVNESFRLLSLGVNSN